MQLHLPALPAFPVPDFRRWTVYVPSRARQVIAAKRGVICLAAIAGVGLGGGLASGAFAGMPTCPTELAILGYPHYSRKGLIEKYVYRCGKPDRTCRVREYTAQGPVHVCSPFALSSYGE